ncbi:hypothetical protein ABIB82_007079, partial [Bradyrhizobium sp. i1.8.4]|uniref:hypothetical protein n=1 Tax=unclassified Bradyrhizobium TaxID=2631580 RepID=UPI003D1DF7D7
KNYIQLHRADPTTTGENTKTIHFKVFQQTARSSEMVHRHVRQGALLMLITGWKPRIGPDLPAKPLI